MNYESSAKQILNVLGKDNIQSATHCMTRLRFVLKDEAGIDDAAEKPKEKMTLKGVGNAILDYISGSMSALIPALIEGAE